jgi:hypothetical protein
MPFASPALLIRLTKLQFRQGNPQQMKGPLG